MPTMFLDTACLGMQDTFTLRVLLHDLKPERVEYMVKQSIVLTKKKKIGRQSLI